MNIVSADFITSATTPSQYPKLGLTEIAFVGRSNVGKSSLINKICNRKKLVKTSSTPGKTQLINFFLINESFIFVDLPGYGYAKVPLRVKNQWQNMIETYLKTRKQLKGIIQIVDFRHGLTQNDLIMVNWLNYLDCHKLIVSSKVDKIPKTRRRTQEKKIKQAILAHSPIDEFSLFSAKTGEGAENILNIISNWTK